MKKALIAMSGGVDSGVAAYFMKRRGYDCIGATMRLYDGEENASDCEKSCCNADAVDDARSVAEQLGMPYYVFNFKADFKEQVIDRFVRVYEQGCTPNPCIECNRRLKFDKLMQRMEELGCDYVVTGHYAVIEERDGRYYLKKGRDASKDQSYVLYALTQRQLAHTLFPLGEYTKQEIRQIAEREGFHNAKKRESQDICFVPDGDYAAFIERYTNRQYPEGEFVSKSGEVLGRHRGLIRYTVGQRKGLGIALGHPAFVVAKDTAHNRVVLGTNEDLMCSRLEAEDFNWIVPPRERFSCNAKTRYNMREQPCTVTVSGERVTVEFDAPVRAVTSGQAVVLYDGDYVLGGGTIV